VDVEEIRSAFADFDVDQKMCLVGGVGSPRPRPQTPSPSPVSPSPVPDIPVPVPVPSVSVPVPSVPVPVPTMRRRRRRALCPHVILQSKTPVDDTQYGPCNQSIPYCSERSELTALLNMVFPGGNHKAGTQLYKFANPADPELLKAHPVSTP
jgi:hypothetical protein